MNYSVLPPEMLSGQMFSGPGSAPMLAAAQAWTGLADELTSSGAGFSSIVSHLAGSAWQGPAAEAMVATAGPYASWLNAAAGKAAIAATQASAMAAIQDVARSTMVPPLAVAGNRMQFFSLVRANVLGFLAPAIAATEGAYEEMWATDVTAMTAYHGGAAAAAAQLMDWEQLPMYLPAGSPVLTFIDEVELLVTRASQLIGMERDEAYEWVKRLGFSSRQQFETWSRASERNGTVAALLQTGARYLSGAELRRAIEYFLSI